MTFVKVLPKSMSRAGEFTRPYLSYCQQLSPAAMIPTDRVQIFNLFKNGIRDPIASTLVTPTTNTLIAETVP